MPIPEQFARVWLATLLVTYGIYFALVPRVDTGSMWSQLLAFGATAVVQAVIVAVASAWMELRHRGGPRRDERDRAIEQRATSVAYHVLMVGVILSGCIMPFSHNGWALFHAAVAAIAIAEMVRNGVIVVLYRRGWHG